MPDWVRPVFDYMLHVGLKHTLQIAAVSVVASALIGVILGTLLTIRFLPLQALIRGYIEIWRGLPIIVTIFAMFFLLPRAAEQFGFEFLRLSALNAAIVGLSLWGSAQIAEATRGAVQSIPREQHEAAAALGFGWIGRHLHVILPQSFRRLLPPFVSLVVNIIQNSTLAQILGVPEILETGKRSIERLNQPVPFGVGDPHAFAIYGAVLVFFFVISFPLTLLARWLERRLV